MDKGKSNPSDSIGRTGKYFKYAIGEIILVVIGILIALQLNNLNDSIKIGKEEKSSLLKLHEESEAIVNSIKISLAFKDSLVQSMDMVARALENTNFETISKKHLELGIEGIGFYAAINLPNSVYNELFSSGKLQNIKSEKILTSISKYYSDLEYVKSQLGYFRSSALYLETDIHTDSYLYIYDSTSTEKYHLKIDKEVLMNDANFKSRHLHGLRNQIVFKNYISDLLTSAKGMCKAVSAELKTECSSNDQI